jgi:PTS system nitrogen regulatory IIA component
MELTDLIARDAILPAVKAGSKKQILQEIAAKAREAREKLGSTAMGGGVAIPHARLEGLDSIAGLFARLEKPADFEAVDGQGVDLVFVLLAPEESGADHLRALARVSRLLHDTDLRKKLRETSEAEALYALITDR